MKLPWPPLLLTFSLIYTIQIFSMHYDLEKKFTECITDIQSNSINGNSEESAELIKQLAEQGHVDSMISFISSQLELSGFLEEDLQKTSSFQKEENLQYALKWFARYFIRTQQDTACYSNNVEIAALIKKSLKEQPFFQFINKSITNKELAAMVLEQIEWAEQKTNDNQLPPPTWITDYCDKIVDLNPQIFPESEWQNKRLQALKIIKKETKHHI